MILPAALILATFQYLPALNVFQISLTDRLLLRPTSNFTGLENYMRLIEDARFWNAVWNTVYFVVASVPLQIALAVVLALLLAGRVKYKDVFRTTFFLPVAGSLVALSIIWDWIYHPRLGALNNVLQPFGVPRIDWLADSAFAMPAIVMLVVWTGTGYYMVIYLAGLMDIPNHYYDAARIDGATAWQRFRSVTWPLLTPTTYLVLVLQVINSFQVFTTVFVMTGGGPSRSTEVLVYYLYTRAFESMEFGYASAISVVLFVSLLVLTVSIRRLYARRVVYDR
ncbi:MAG: carbohydrate ABC transporter permease [Spirochaetia bacterium]